MVRQINNWLAVNGKDVAVVIALAGVIWWASRIDDKVVQIELRGSPGVAIIDNKLAVIEANQQSVLRRLDGIERLVQEHMMKTDKPKSE